MTVVVHPSTGAIKELQSSPILVGDLGRPITRCLHIFISTLFVFGGVWNGGRHFFFIYLTSVWYFKVFSFRKSTFNNHGIVLYCKYITKKKNFYKTAYKT